MSEIPLSGVSTILPIMLRAIVPREITGMRKEFRHGVSNLYAVRQRANSEWDASEMYDNDRERSASLSGRVSKREVN